MIMKLFKASKNGFHTNELSKQQQQELENKIKNQNIDSSKILKLIMPRLNSHKQMDVKGSALNRFFIKNNNQIIKIPT